MSETIRTNHHRRELINGFSLSEAERAQFDYLDWDAIKAGEDSAMFFRYKGELYDLGSFMRLDSTPGWDAGMATSAFGGIVIRLDPEDNELIIVGETFS